MSTGIQWTDETWTPVTGCEQITPGCAHCYAKTEHDRRHKASLAGKKMAPQYAQPFETVQLQPQRLTEPLSWKAPRKVFVCSGADLFHDDVPDAYIARVWAVMMLAERHTFQVLTKRPARMRDLLSSDTFMDLALDAAEEFYPRTGRDESHSYYDWCSWVLGDGLDGEPAPWIWVGVSVENQRFADERIPILLQTPAAVRFLSLEPLLGPVDLTRVCLLPTVAGSARAGIHLNALAGKYVESGMPYIGNWDVRSPYPVDAPALSLDWAIVGGESGTDARPFDIAWARRIVSDCASLDVPVFIKQLGDAPYHLVDGVKYPVSFGRHGADFDGWEEQLRIREFPCAPSETLEKESV